MIQRQPFSEFLKGSFVGVMLRRNDDAFVSVNSNQAQLACVDDALPYEELGYDNNYFSSYGNPFCNIWVTDSKWIDLLKEKYPKSFDESSKHAMLLVYVVDPEKYTSQVSQERLLASMYGAIKRCGSRDASSALEFNI